MALLQRGDLANRPAESMMQFESGPVVWRELVPEFRPDLAQPSAAREFRFIRSDRFSNHAAPPVNAEERSEAVSMSGVDLQGRSEPDIILCSESVGNLNDPIVVCSVGKLPRRLIVEAPPGVVFPAFFDARRQASYSRDGFMSAPEREQLSRYVELKAAGVARAACPPVISRHTNSTGGQAASATLNCSVAESVNRFADGPVDRARSLLTLRPVQISSRSL